MILILDEENSRPSNNEIYTSLVGEPKDSWLQSTYIFDIGHRFLPPFSGHPEDTLNTTSEQNTL